MTAATLLLCAGLLTPATQPPIRTAQNGRWSDPQTWEGRQVPGPGANVLVRGEHRVTYDVGAAVPLRAVQVAGQLIFADDRSTQLDVGLLVLQRDESGIDEAGLGTLHHHHDHHHAPNNAPNNQEGSPPSQEDAPEPLPLLQIGAPEHPLPAHLTARLRLRYQPGMDPNIAPALLSQGGRVELHGAPLARTWVKLAQPAAAGSRQVMTQGPLSGWRVGDRVIVTSTATPPFFNEGVEAVNVPMNIARSLRGASETEERVITAIHGATLQFAEPLAHAHRVHDAFRGDVGNLSRNIVVESADAHSEGGRLRGHTMFHKFSPTALSYVELRHLGKRDVLGRYAVHFHQVMDSIRGSSVLGCSIWDSDNRWLTIHGTEYLVVRDNVGYQSVGHGFFFEDSTETYNILDRNLAVGSFIGKPLPHQALGADHNDGGNFWWANSFNVFTRNVAVEGDQYGFRFEASVDPRNTNIVQPVRQPDGTRVAKDTRTLPFIRFEDNEAHAQRRFGLNLGGSPVLAGGHTGNAFMFGDAAPHPELSANTVEGAGPDFRHPFIVRDFQAWATDWPFHSAASSVLVDGLSVFDTTYVIWRCNAYLQEYRRISQENEKAPTLYQSWGGTRSLEQAAQEFLAPVDDLPPFTVITQVSRRSDGSLYVRGTAADDGKVAEVRVNALPARALDKDFAQWEVVLPAEAWQSAPQLVAKSFDGAGHEELTPHSVQLALEPYVR